jgi:hypothetical protein
MQEPLFVGALDKQRFSVGCNDRLTAKQGTVKRRQKYKCESACELQSVRWGSEDAEIKNGAMLLQEVRGGLLPVPFKVK